ncbi:MAG: ribosome small subunit-dependent GTPase A [Erysipelothrix sp.]|nr:ribosome small subunit-dependent GTPase A [Erysipelothrix sp.]
MKKESLSLRSDLQFSIKAIVSEVSRGKVKVLCQHGEISAKLKGTFYRNGSELSIVPVVGDEVWLQYNDSGVSLITEICERRSFFVRTDFSGHAVGYVKTVKQQVLASNFDVVFILASLNQEFNLKRIERYLTTALSSKAEVVIVLTKSDLVEDSQMFVEQVRREFQNVACFAFSSKTGYGLDILENYVKKGRIVVFLGSSGVGKSSLVNFLAKKNIMEVSEIREKDDRGRHTTTHRQLILLSNGAMVIDTPGIRELGLWDAKEGISEVFYDIESLIRMCRFSDCTHGNEPGCMIQESLMNQKLSVERWQRYLILQKENEWGRKKSALVKK